MQKSYDKLNVHDTSVFSQNVICWFLARKLQLQILKYLPTYVLFMYFRDLGERLRQLVAQEFPQGPISKVNELKLNRDFESLNRIANNEYRDRFPRKFTDSTVFGWELEDYIAATSNEGIAFLNKETQKK